MYCKSWKKKCKILCYPNLGVFSQQVFETCDVPFYAHFRRQTRSVTGQDERVRLQVWFNFVELQQWQFFNAARYQRVLGFPYKFLLLLKTCTRLLNLRSGVVRPTIYSLKIQKSDENRCKTNLRVCYLRAR